LIADPAEGAQHRETSLDGVSAGPHEVLRLGLVQFSPELLDLPGNLCFQTGLSGFKSAKAIVDLLFVLVFGWLRG
jgi:hypothetical protein